MQENEDALHYQEQQTAQQIRQATANLAAAQAQRQEASADYENARVEFGRVEELEKTGAVSKQQVDRERTTSETTRAKLDAAERQLEAQRAALALAQAAVTQVAMKRERIAARSRSSGGCGADAEGRRPPRVQRDPRSGERHRRRARGARRARS